jgi:hypothetical protein
VPCTATRCSFPEPLSLNLSCRGRRQERFLRTTRRTSTSSLRAARAWPRWGLAPLPAPPPPAPLPPQPLAPPRGVDSLGAHASRRRRAAAGDAVLPGLHHRQVLPPPPPLPPRTKWTRRVTHPVLMGHAASLSQVLPPPRALPPGAPRPAPRAPDAAAAPAPARGPRARRSHGTEWAAGRSVPGPRRPRLRGTLPGARRRAPPPPPPVARRRRPPRALRRPPPPRWRSRCRRAPAPAARRRVARAGRRGGGGGGGGGARVRGGAAGRPGGGRVPHLPAGRRGGRHGTEWAAGQSRGAGAEGLPRVSRLVSGWPARVRDRGAAGARAAKTENKGSKHTPRCCWLYSSPPLPRPRAPCTASAPFAPLSPSSTNSSESPAPASAFSAPLRSRASPDAPARPPIAEGSMPANTQFPSASSSCGAAPRT